MSNIYHLTAACYIRETGKQVLKQGLPTCIAHKINSLNEIQNQDCILTAFLLNDLAPERSLSVTSNHPHKHTHTQTHPFSHIKMQGKSSLLNNV